MIDFTSNLSGVVKKFHHAKPLAIMLTYVLFFSPSFAVAEAAPHLDVTPWGGYWPKPQELAGTLNYNDIAGHDCMRGFEQPARFIAKDASIFIFHPDRDRWKTKPATGTKWITVSKPHKQIKIQEARPEVGFLLDVDVIFCISVFSNRISSGKWRIGHESGREDLTAKGLVKINGPRNNYVVRGISNYQEMTESSLWVNRAVSTENGVSKKSKYPFEIGLYLDFGKLDASFGDNEMGNISYADIDVIIKLVNLAAGGNP